MIKLFSSKQVRDEAFYREYIEKRLYVILETLKHDSFEVIVNYSKNKLSGFFINYTDSVRISINSRLERPNTTHELNCKEFCIFLHKYYECSYSNKESVIEHVMSYHKKLLES